MQQRRARCSGQEKNIRSSREQTRSHTRSPLTFLLTVRSEGGSAPQGLRLSPLLLSEMGCPLWLGAQGTGRLLRGHTYACGLLTSHRSWRSRKNAPRENKQVRAKQSLQLRYPEANRREPASDQCNNTVSIYGDVPYAHCPRPSLPSSCGSSALKIRPL